MTDVAPTRLPWRRIFAEGGAIVVSILMAFAIDAWWDEAGERDLEHTMLVGLQTEFTVNRNRLEVITEGHDRTYAAAVALMVMSDAGEAAPADSMEYLLRNVFVDAYSYNPSGGVLEGLIASGELGIVDNPELRALLASWPGQVEDNAEDEAWVFKDVQDVYTPFLNRALPTRGIFSSDTDLPEASAQPSYAGVLGSTEFENLVAMRAYGARILMEENEALMGLIDQILRLIDDELD